jgi:cation diffusion facilitator CzcD-associated flavoprotein CzcO
MHLKSKDQAASRDLVAGTMKEKLNNDPYLTKHMVPEFALGCRRMTPGSGYLESLTRSNVEVVTEEVVRLTEDEVVDALGTEHKVDVVVCATGFDTTFTPHFECIGRDGRSLKEQFGDFPKGYLGIMAENFPNLFRKFSCIATLSLLWDVSLNKSLSFDRSKRSCKSCVVTSDPGMAYPLHVSDGDEAVRREHQML